MRMTCGIGITSSNRVRTHALARPLRALELHREKKEKGKNEKRREEANTPEISLVVLQTWRRWTLRKHLLVFCESWWLYQFGSLRKCFEPYNNLTDWAINCYVKLVLLIFFSKTLGLKDPKGNSTQQKDNPQVTEAVPRRMVPNKSSLGGKE